MAARHTLHVALTEPLVNYVGKQVASGRYATASEVVRAALRLLEQSDPRRHEQDAQTDNRQDC
jgi:antitoxin ParD1/3/4